MGGVAIFIVERWGFEESNAMRTSIASEGLTELNLYFHFIFEMKMQTNLQRVTFRLKNLLASLFFATCGDSKDSMWRERAPPATARRSRSFIFISIWK